MKVTLSNFSFDNLFSHEKALSAMQPSSNIGTLNSALLIQDKEVYLQIKDATSFVKVQLDCDVEWENEEAREAGVILEYQKLFYILHSYTEDSLQAATFILEIEDGEVESFLIMAANDKLMIPHGPLEEDQRAEYTELNKILKESFEQQTSPTWPDQVKFDFLTGVTQCLQFISNDERKNNALAIYDDKIVVNDKRHVFIYNLDSPTPLTNGEVSTDDSWLALHKKGARILSLLGLSAIEIKELIVNQDKVFIKTPSMEGMISNAISNIVPPSEEDLKNLKPAQKAFDIDASVLKETCAFFNGFYMASMEWNPLTIENDEKGLTFLLKDSGFAGYGSCNIERKMNPELLTTEDRFSATIINDSLRSFLSKFNKEERPLEVYITENSPAVYVKEEKTQIYLAKLQ